MEMLLLANICINSLITIFFLLSQRFYPSFAFMFERAHFFAPLQDLAVATTQIISYIGFTLWFLVSHIIHIIQLHFVFMKSGTWKISISHYGLCILAQICVHTMNHLRFIWLIKLIGHAEECFMNNKIQFLRSWHGCISLYKSISSL